MDPVTSQIVVVVLFGLWVLLAPSFLNKFADSRSQPRVAK